MAHSASQGQNSNAVGMVLLGAMAGALAALLLAPKRGTEMREDLRGQYNDMMNKTHDTMDRAAGKMKQSTEKMRSKAHDAADKADASIDTVADKAQDIADKTEEKTAASRRRSGRSDIEM